MTTILKFAAYLTAALSLGAAVAVFAMTGPLAADPVLGPIVDAARWPLALGLLLGGAVAAALLAAFAALVEHAEATKFATQALARAEHARPKSQRA